MCTCTCTCTCLSNTMCISTCVQQTSSHSYGTVCIPYEGLATRGTGFSVLMWWVILNVVAADW